MGERKANQNFEMTFFLNENIVCQRYFNVNNFNPEAKKSYNFKETCDGIVEQIREKVKEKSLNHMTKFSYFYDEDPNSYDTNGEYDYYQIVVKEFDKTLYARSVPAYVYPTKIRKNVDIRSLIPQQIDQIQRVLSTKNKNLSFERKCFYENPPV